jgi:hypothetical protein
MAREGKIIVPTYSLAFTNKIIGGFDFNNKMSVCLIRVINLELLKQSSVISLGQNLRQRIGDITKTSMGHKKTVINITHLK